MRSGTSKRPVPVFRWDRSEYQPAVPPGLAPNRAPSCVLSYADLWLRRVVSVSHTQVPLFCSPSEVHSLPALLPPSHRRRLSVKKVNGKYSLFLNGLAKNSTPAFPDAIPRIVLPLYFASRVLWTASPVHRPVFRPLRNDRLPAEACGIPVKESQRFRQVFNEKFVRSLRGQFPDSSLRIRHHTVPD